jgi:hypothetical protein
MMWVRPTVTASSIIARFELWDKVRCHRVRLWKRVYAAAYDERYIWN